jgi:hypothetical protein
MMKVICSSETSLLARATLRHILEDGTVHSHYRENIKSYKIELLPNAAILQTIFIHSKWDLQEYLKVNPIPHSERAASP